MSVMTEEDEDMRQVGPDASAERSTTVAVPLALGSAAQASCVGDFLQVRFTLCFPRQAFTHDSRVDLFMRAVCATRALAA